MVVPSAAGATLVAPDPSMDPQLGADLTNLFAQVRRGDPLASDKLHSLIYSELHRIARRCMRGQPRGHTLQPTALVNEAYVRLSTSGSGEWRDRAHFLAAAARAMRCVLIDHARARRLREHGSLDEPSAMDQVVVTYEDRAFDLLALDSALDRLAHFDPMMAKAVELRFFGGLDVEEVARVLRISKRTLEREWSATRAWLYQEIA